MGRLTANLAHEIRNPLSAIHHAAELLREEGHAPMQERLCHIIEDNARRLNHLVDDVLSLSRRDCVHCETLRLDEVLSQFRDEVQRNQQVEPGILELAVTEGLAICFDRLHLEQILWNLCRNAWRYCCKRPGSIRISASPSEGRVDIEVSNDGPPIRPVLQQHLFEPFYTTDSRGTGLGLYISRELAEANQGRLECVPQTEGARFRLTCPLPPC